MAGARILELFGDAATDLCLRETGGRSEGLLRAYHTVDFLHPVYKGDRVTATATVVGVGNTSRTLRFEAYKTGPKRILVAKADGTVVIPRGTA